MEKIKFKGKNIKSKTQKNKTPNMKIYLKNYSFFQKLYLNQHFN